MAKKSSPIKVAELFAGVGGFREAMVAFNKQNGSDQFRVVWSNQWEPSESSKVGEHQFANRVYNDKFKGKGHYTDDIHEITDEEEEASIRKVVPPIDMLVGGFPCQDYSVAKPKNSSKGLRGPKGILWWSIDRLLEIRKPKYVLLENVDRLLNSPAGNRGKDFAIILKRLNTLKYAVEWRIVNAADYGFPQKRRRIFILAYKRNSVPGKLMKSFAKKPEKFLESDGLMARALPCGLVGGVSGKFDFSSFPDLDTLKKRYQRKVSPFLSGGMMFNHLAVSARILAQKPEKSETLGDVVRSVAPYVRGDVSKFFIKGSDLIEGWAYAKGRKNEPRRKLSALLSFLEGHPKIAGKFQAVELKALAKVVPGELALDYDIVVEYNGRSRSIRLAREELNYKVATLLGVDANPLRPNLIDRAQINKVIRDSALRAELETFAAGILADRVISLFGIKEKAKQQTVKAEMVARSSSVIDALLADKVVRKFSVGEHHFELDRDEVSGASFAYGYKEGGMAFPDSWAEAGRTIITSEGGASVSRFKHVICDECANAGKPMHKDCAKAGKLRRLYPRELEAMNGFSLSHSEACERLKISDGRRAFFMGNALVVGVVKQMLKALVS